MFLPVSVFTAAALLAAGRLPAILEPAEGLGLAPALVVGDTRLLGAEVGLGHRTLLLELSVAEVVEGRLRREA